jgi:hypothetical protein
MAFDIEGARKAGYSDAEIADYLATERGFNIGGARESGYSDPEIIRHLTMLPTRPVEETPALANPTMAAQFAKARGNVTPPDSVMDPRYPAWAKNQNDAAALDALSGVAMPLAGGILKPGATTVRNMARGVMQSALKPTQSDLMTGKADRAVNTMLDKGINVTRGGMAKLREEGSALNDQAANVIANSTATVDKAQTAVPIDRSITRLEYSNPTPSAPRAQMEAIRDEYLANPLIPPQIPVQRAQALKQGIHKELKDEYGTLGSASVEAKKALAAGLRTGIEQAVPEVVPINAQAADIWNALSVAERRALIAGNNNPLGLGPLSGNIPAAAIFELDRSQGFKSLLARMLNNSQRVPGVLGGGAVGLLMQPQQGALSQYMNQPR